MSLCVVRAQRQRILSGPVQVLPKGALLILLILKCLRFSFPLAGKSLPESEPRLLFIFNSKPADILQAPFWLISSDGGKVVLFPLRLSPYFKNIAFSIRFLVSYVYFPPIVIVAFVFYNEHRQILKRGRKVSQNTLFFLVLDLISKECYFKYLYTFCEHPGTQPEKDS